MKLLALLIGLIVERLATQLFHLRELRWLDTLIDAGFRAMSRLSDWPALVPVMLLTALLVLPVLLVRLALGDTLYGFPYLILAVFVLFFSLGPKDIGEDIDEYCQALEHGDEERIASTAKALIEADPPDDPLERVQRVEEAVCVQANNRLFAVIFWFVLLGPVAAWAYRVTDLVRRRAVFKVTRDEGKVEPRVVMAASTVHGWLAWVPARLTAIGFGMAGSLDGALAAWRAFNHTPALPQNEQSERLLARVGAGALGMRPIEGEGPSDRGIRGATAASGLVFRLLFIWAAVIAAMTLYGWSV